MDLDKWIEKNERCEILRENDLKRLCLYVMDILIEQPNVMKARTPVNVCGDVHGQFHDVMELFRQGGDVPGSRYVFMGDYVDRGFHSVETMTYLLLLKAKYPNDILLLRGNHESRQITKSYGFYDEIVRKYGNGSAWKYFCDLFDTMSLSAVIDGKIFCVHGGLSPHIKKISQIDTLNRRAEIGHEGALCEIMWSDPEDSITTWELNQRGVGYMFGKVVADDFCRINNLELICRSHQIAEKGYKYHFCEGEDEETSKVLTVWSCPNYTYRCGNLASILEIDSQRRREFKVFSEVEENRKTGEMMKVAKPSYFL